MTALRSRNLPPKDPDRPSSAPPTAKDDSSTSTSKPKAYLSDPDEGPSRLSLLDVLRVLSGLFLLSSTLSYFITGNSILWGYRPAITRPARIKAWLVRESFPCSPSKDGLAANAPPFLARSLRFDRRSIVIIQRHGPHSSHPCRCQWDYLRRLRLPALLRPGR